MTQNGNLAVWTANLTAPNPGNLCYIHAHAWANITGIAFLASQNLQFRPPGAFTAQNNADGTCTFASNSTVVTNGSFTGSFTGAVIDTSALPQSLIVTGYFMLVIAGAYLLSWLGKGQALYATMLALAGELFAGMMLLDNQSLLQAGTFVPLLVLIAVTIILLSTRLFLVGWAKPVGEEAGVE